jgi:hypothetical protein
MWMISNAIVCMQLHQDRHSLHQASQHEFDLFYQNNDLVLKQKLEVVTKGEIQRNHDRLGVYIPRLGSEERLNGRLWWDSKKEGHLFRCPDPSWLYSARMHIGATHNSRTSVSDLFHRHRHLLSWVYCQTIVTARCHGDHAQDVSLPST